MFDLNDNNPLPDAPALKELVRKARAELPFSSSDYRWLTNILYSLESSAMYKLKERMRRFEAEEARRHKP